MIKLKKCIIMLIFTVMISIPAAAIASVASDSQAINSMSNFNKPLDDREKREKIKEDYFKTFEKADKYIPGIKTKGEELYNTRRELMKELREVIREKEDQNLDGNEPKPTEKVDKEKESKEHLHLKDKHRIKDEKMKIQNEKTKNAYRDFVKAVDSGDKDSINKTFNIFEENSKSFNELLKNKINDIRSK